LLWLMMETIFHQIAIIPPSTLQSSAEWWLLSNTHSHTKTYQRWVGTLLDWVTCICNLCSRQRNEEQGEARGMKSCIQRDSLNEKNIRKFYL
jgi:hypothetical protein